MKKLQIVRVDNDLVQKANLQIGNNLIGRGAATGVSLHAIVSAQKSVYRGYRIMHKSCLCKSARGWPN